MKTCPKCYFKLEDCICEPLIEVFKFLHTELPIDRLMNAMLEYNFEPEDIKEHREELLQQLWYESTENNLNFLPC